MRILLALRHSGYTRHFGSTIELLGERGHEIVLVLGKHWRQDESIQGAVAKLGLDVPGLRIREGVETHRRVERDLASALRNYLAYLWFLEPGLARAKKPRERSSGNVPPSLRAASAAAAENALSLRFLESKVGELERALPLSDSYRQLVVEENPDAVVVSPLLERGVPQIGYLRAARELGIPTGLCVASWDNLTNKGPLFGPIDLVTVWNDSQKREAVELHRVPPERARVTGAPLYDKWFGLSPAMSRETFCRHVGLPSTIPICFTSVRRGSSRRTRRNGFCAGSGAFELAPSSPMCRFSCGRTPKRSCPPAPRPSGVSQPLRESSSIRGVVSKP